MATTTTLASRHREPCPICDARAGLACFCPLQLIEILRRGDDELLRRIWRLPEDWRRPHNESWPEGRPADGLTALPIVEVARTPAGELPGLEAVLAARTSEAKDHHEQALRLAVAGLRAEALTEAAEALMADPFSATWPATLRQVATDSQLLWAGGMNLLREVLPLFMRFRRRH